MGCMWWFPWRVRAICPSRHRECRHRPYQRCGNRRKPLPPRVGIELRHEGGEEIIIGEIVAFGNPHIFPLREFQAVFPLHESAARIFGVENHMAHLGMIAVAVDNRAAVVAGAIVEQNKFEIAHRLLQHAVDALPQVRRMVVVWYYYGNLGVHSVGCHPFSAQR